MTQDIMAADEGGQGRRVCRTLPNLLSLRSRDATIILALQVDPSRVPTKPPVCQEILRELIPVNSAAFSFAIRAI
jgi:hypothetical protein